MGKNINEIDHTNIILNGIYIAYSVLFLVYLPKFHPVPFASNLIRMPKLRRFLMIGQRSNSCRRHSPSTSFNSKTGWILYQIKLSRKSNG